MPTFRLGSTIKSIRVDTAKDLTGAVSTIVKLTKPSGEVLNKTATVEGSKLKCSLPVVDQTELGGWKVDGRYTIAGENFITQEGEIFFVS